MSHFTVVIATKTPEDLEDVLEPYNENTPVEPYWEEDSLEYLKSMEDSAAPEDATPEQLVAFYNERYGEDEGTSYRVENGVIERQTTYNPDSKWDYWRIGGRWAGRFRLKPGAVGTLAPLSWEWSFDEKDKEAAEKIDGVDQARKGDIDIAGMREDAGGQAAENWDTYAALVAEHGQIVPWTEIRDKHPNDIQAARKEYHAQPIVEAAKEAKLVDFMSGIEDEFGDHTRETYIQYARDHALTGYAFLSRETGWVEPGSMGWWGMSSDTVASRIEYARKVAQIIDDLDDDTVLTLVDCHI